MFKGWGLAVILVAAAGALLAWAVQPVIIAFGAGRMIGRMEGARKTAAGRGEPLPPEKP
jgi:hypothetical protein